MPSILLSNLCLLLVITSFVNGTPIVFPNNMENGLNDHSLRYRDDRLTKMKSLSISSTDHQRRNVVMPRICYFARVTKSGVHQKICIP